MTPAPDKRLVRVDFVAAGTRCASCARELTVGHIVLEGDTERAYGPVCVSRLFDSVEAFRRIRATVPDLTRRAVRTEDGPPITSTAGDEGHGQDPASRAARHAAEYLWLRLHSLTRLYPEQRAALSWPPLEECFDRLKAQGHLSEPDVQRVLRIEARAPLRLRLQNLLDAYAAAGQLRRRLQSSTLTPGSRAFYESLFDQLGRKLRLSMAQIRQADLDLQESAFAWANVEQH